MHRPLRSDYTLGLQCQVAALFRPAVWHSHPFHPPFYQRLLHTHMSFRFYVAYHCQIFRN